MDNWNENAFWIFISIGLFCKLIALKLKQSEKAEKPVEVKMNRQQRRHPDGYSPAQRFQRVSVKGRQRQGNGRAMRGW